MQPGVCPRQRDAANVGVLGDDEKRGVLGWTDGLLRAVKCGPVGAGRAGHVRLEASDVSPWCERRARRRGSVIRNALAGQRWTRPLGGH